MWRRLPTWFPNLRLQMLPLTQEQKATLYDTGWLREVAFKCEPRVNKLEIKAFLESVHGMKVERVNTINYQGKKKRDVDWQGKPHFYRRSDWKKAYVLFQPPADIKQQWLSKQAQQQLERAEQLKQAGLGQMPRLPNFLPAAAAAVARDAAPKVAAAAAAAVKERQAQRAAQAAAAAKRLAREGRPKQQQQQPPKQQHRRSSSRNRR